MINEYFSESRLNALKFFSSDIYKPSELISKQFITVVCFPPKQIVNIMSKYFILGAVEKQNRVTLIEPDRNVKNDAKFG